MKKIVAKVSGGVLAAGLIGFLIWDNVYSFKGDGRHFLTGRYYADFYYFNGNERFEFQLETGEKLHLDAHIEKGKAKVSFTRKCEKSGEVISNIEDADFFIATTGNDEANLLSCILVRKYNVPNIIARVSNPDHEEAFKEVGIDQVISPEITAAGYLQKIVTRPNVAELITLGEGDAEILDMTITNDKIIGKRFKDISPTKEYIIIATYQKGNLVIPQPDNIISRGEKVSVLVKRGNFKKVSKKLEK